MDEYYNMKNQSLEKSLLKSVSEAGLNKITKDLVEVGLDQIIKNGVLKDIPVVNTLVSVLKTGIGLREAVFVKKLYRFLFELNDIPHADRVKFVEDLESKPEESFRVGEKLL